MTLEPITHGRCCGFMLSSPIYSNKVRTSLGLCWFVFQHSSTDDLTFQHIRILLHQTVLFCLFFAILVMLGPISVMPDTNTIFYNIFYTVENMAGTYLGVYIS